MHVHIIDSELIQLSKLDVYLTHLSIILHKVSLQEFAGFHKHDEIDWDKAVKHQIEAEKAG